MKNNKYLYLIIGFLIGVISVLSFWIFSYSDSNINKNPMRMMAQRNNIDVNPDTIDAHFIEQMIPHHEDAVTMSELALVRATRPEMKELATNIIDSQRKEIGQMKEWYEVWFDRELPQGDEVMAHHGMMRGARMHMGMMGGDMDLEDLENSEDFDREFIVQMIPHHQMAVMMASMLKNGTGKEEMKELADNIIKSQTAEIDLMRGWLQDWE